MHGCLRIPVESRVVFELSRESCSCFYWRCRKTSQRKFFEDQRADFFVGELVHKLLPSDRIQSCLEKVQGDTRRSNGIRVIEKN